MAHPMLEVFKTDARAILSDLGQPASYAPSGGTGAAVSVIVSELGADLAGAAPTGLSPEFGYAQGRWIVLLVHVDDLAARPAKDADTVALDGEAWTVRQVRPVMCGAMFRLWCSTDERGLK